MSDAATGDVVLDVRDLSVAYQARGAEVRAVRGVSLQVHAGETLALVGESGSGKTSLALAVMRYLDASGRVTGGAIRFHGEDLLTLPAAALRELRGARLAMVYQDPQTALNPAFPVGEQVAEALRIHLRLGHRDARRRAVELLAQVNLPQPEQAYARYPHELSGGQQQRVVIAMAFACDPELLLMDEPTTGLDVTTEARILDLVAELKARHRSAILYITHNLGVVARFCHRVAVMYAGELVEDGPVERVFARPLHPYTRGLLACVPRLDASKQAAPLAAIGGQLPSLVAPPRGCIFEPRCPDRVPLCAERAPAATAAPGGGTVRCHRWDELPAFRVASVPAVAAGPSPDARPPGLLQVDGLRCHYRLGRPLADAVRGIPPRAVRAVDDVSLEVARAHTLALVGESGCGKTTLGRAVVGLLEPVGGRIAFGGADAAQLARRRPRDLRRRIQIIFQNPEATLNPQRTVGETLARPLELFGVGTAARRAERVRELLRAVQLPETYIDRYPHELSGGEKQRVAVARAFAAEPELVVCDEPLSALDVSVQAAVLNLLVDLQTRTAAAYLFISHDLSVVRYLADRVAVMYMGRLCELGSVDALFAPPYHPYTEALLSAIPLPDPRSVQRKVRLEGPVPSPVDPGPGCRFQSRCPRKLGAVCETEPPPAREAAPGHVIVCHIPLEELRRVPPVIEGRPAATTPPGGP
ncbi:MAG TPA: ABC transporter ATP-binding protein [Methylomirabilota bacterium]